ncbi:MAG: serine hydrolase [Dehalococcoidia bacterium]|nr:serine hydrolase [Dehalococcoidia bacterium]
MNKAKITKTVVIGLLILAVMSILLIPACTKTEPAPSPAPTPVPTPAPEPGSLEQRLDLLVEQLEQQREALHVPGMAIAVVKDDEVVLAHGFGVTNIDTETPVTPETIFAIGSSTKAFTATLVGMLVDEGKMDWDNPITDYLPYFQLNIESDDENVETTIRDLLCHRTGYPRMGLLFASGEIPREEVLRAATVAEPYTQFREKFYYSNVMYMAAGVAAARAAGTDWDILIAERIFEPLVMESTSTSISQAQTDPRLSLGYLWDEDLQAYKHKPMRNVDNIGPSGSINSNVLDMAQWLRLQLGMGQYEGLRLISEEQLRETWTSQIEITEGVSYGLGWMLREWEGQPVVEHGGNIDGFSAEVALLPESNLGFVLLTNASVTPLQQQSINMVWEALLGEWKDADATDTTEDYEPYIGKYIANFGQFQDTEFTVLVQNDRLAIDVPGQQIFELKEPDEEGKWYFVISDEIAISFERDDTGNVIGMKLYQAGLTFELPKKGAEVKPEIPLEELQKYLGSYRSEELGITVEVLIQNNRLAIDWPGEMTYELYPPDEQGIWVFRVSERFTLRFNETLDGQIESLTYYQDDKEYLMPRAEAELMPTVEEILALRNTESRKAAIGKMGDYQVNGTIHSVQSGVKGTFTMYVSSNGRYRIDSDYGRYGYSRTAVNGDQAWVESSFGPFDELHGKLLEQAKMGHPAVMDGDWRDYYDSISVLRPDNLNGRKVYILQLKHGELPPETIFIDAASGDTLKSVVVAIQEGGIGIPITTVYEDYRKVHGLRMPFRSISSNEQSGRTIIQWEKIEVNLSFDDDFFILTPPEE